MSYVPSLSIGPAPYSVLYLSVSTKSIALPDLLFATFKLRKESKDCIVSKSQ